MTFHWAAVHLLPILLIPPIVRYLQGRLEPHAISAVAYLVLIACVAGGQSAALRRRSRSLANAWLPATIAGLAAAWACGLVVIGTLDSVAHWPEPVVVALGHGVMAAVLAAAQSIVLRRYGGSARVWIAATTLLMTALAVVWLPFWNEPRVPGFVRGLFPGSAEMTTLLRVVATYGLASAPLVHRGGIAARMPEAIAASSSGSSNWPFSKQKGPRARR